MLCSLGWFMLVTSYPKPARQHSPEAVENARLYARRHEKIRRKKRASENSLLLAKPAPALFRIYLLTNLKTGLKYVGSTTKSAAVRWQRHIARSRESAAALPQAILEFGEAAFSVSVLNEATNKKAADYLERFWIRELQTLYPFGYNEQEGGSCGFTWSERSRAKMRASIKETNKRKSKEAA